MFGQWLSSLYPISIIKGCACPICNDIYLNTRLGKCMKVEALNCIRRHMLCLENVRWSPKLGRWENGYFGSVALRCDIIAIPLMDSATNPEASSGRPKSNHRGRYNPLTQAKHLQQWKESRSLERSLKAHESRTGMHSIAIVAHLPVISTSCS